MSPPNNPNNSRRPRLPQRRDHRRADDYDSPCPPSNPPLPNLSTGAIFGPPTQLTYAEILAAGIPPPPPLARMPDTVEAQAPDFTGCDRGAHQRQPAQKLTLKRKLPVVPAHAPSGLLPQDVSQAHRGTLANSNGAAKRTKQEPRDRDRQRELEHDSHKRKRDISLITKSKATNPKSPSPEQWQRNEMEDWRNVVTPPRLKEVEGTISKSPELAQWQRNELEDRENVITPPLTKGISGATKSRKSNSEMDERRIERKNEFCRSVDDVAHKYSRNDTGRRIPTSAPKMEFAKSQRKENRVTSPILEEVKNVRFGPLNEDLHHVKSPTLETVRKLRTEELRKSPKASARPWASQQEQASSRAEALPDPPAAEVEPNARAIESVLPTRPRKASTASSRSTDLESALRDLSLFQSISRAIPKPAPWPSNTDLTSHVSSAGLVTLLAQPGSESSGDEQREEKSQNSAARSPTSSLNQDGDDDQESQTDSRHGSLTPTQEDEYEFVNMPEDDFELVHVSEDERGAMEKEVNGRKKKGWRWFAGR
ncbi:hypothetical protein K458DRAFT_385059 [Lentithecium fluviatile CBS 122367]|uniref:Uncharacterized protein n=1 Tax=Lentithecium fluviatile CBS 122367 TaxID=1168545 RepID=A0A6G1JFE2_9PLEO|nr:hypothetical protein K458DRAFT_385059 [Lentithecium fluviatile CBS 122367]